MTSCLEQLPVCKASCCKVFSIDNCLIIKNRSIYKFFSPPELINYFLFHGCNNKNNLIITNSHKHRVVVKDEKTYFYRPCKHLTKKYLCGVHGTDEQPNICKEFDPNIHKTNNRWRVSEGCIAEELTKEE